MEDNHAEDMQGLVVEGTGKKAVAVAREELPKFLHQLTLFHYPASVGTAESQSTSAQTRKN